MKDPRSDVYAFFNQRQHLLGKKLPEPMKLRKSLRGGHCELYLLEAIANSETSIEYYDINSLYVVQNIPSPNHKSLMFFSIPRYPYICMVEDFAVGKSNI